VKANSFEVKTISKYDRFLKYNIVINPVDKNIEAVIKRERSDYGKNIRRRVLKELGLKREDWFKGVIIAYDGGSALYTTDYLGFDELNSVEPIVMKEEITIEDLQNLDGEPTRSGKSSIYNKGVKKQIIGGVELWSGWFSSVRPGQGNLFINVNPTFTTFYQPLDLDEFFSNI
jgi:hypothetical protein